MTTCYLFIFSMHGCLIWNVTRKLSNTFGNVVYGTQISFDLTLGHKCSDPIIIKHVE